MCFALLAPALTCATSAAQPGTGWQKVAPAAVGLDAAKLNEIAGAGERRQIELPRRRPRRQARG